MFTFVFIVDDQLTNGGWNWGQCQKVYPDYIQLSRNLKSANAKRIQELRGICIAIGVWSAIFVMSFVTYFMLTILLQMHPLPAFSIIFHAFTPRPHHTLHCTPPPDTPTQTHLAKPESLILSYALTLCYKLWHMAAQLSHHVSYITVGVFNEALQFLVLWHLKTEFG